MLLFFVVEKINQHMEEEDHFKFQRIPTVKANIDEDKNKLLAQKLFEHRVVKIRYTFKKTDLKDIPNKIPVCIFSSFFKFKKI